MLDIREDWLGAGNGVRNTVHVALGSEIMLKECHDDQVQLIEDSNSTIGFSCHRRCFVGRYLNTYHVPGLALITRSSKQPIFAISGCFRSMHFCLSFFQIYGETRLILIERLIRRLQRLRYCRVLYQVEPKYYHTKEMHFMMA